MRRVGLEPLEATQVLIFVWRCKPQAAHCKRDVQQLHGFPGSSRSAGIQQAVTHVSKCMVDKNQHSEARKIVILSWIFGREAEAPACANRLDASSQ